MSYSLLIGGLVLLLINTSSAQTLDTLFAEYTNQPITIDGQLSESQWEQAQIATDFWQYFPFDTSISKLNTEMRVMYDEEFIYFGAIMYNIDQERSYITPSLRRDFRGEANDGITVVIDPFLDNTNAFQFGVNPFGVQREGLLSNGGLTGTDLDLSWDNIWYSAATQQEGYWTAEMAIPLKTIRFKENSSAFNVKFYRIDSKYTERSSWPRSPRQFSIITLAFMNRLIFAKPLHKEGGNLAIIPYTLGRYASDKTEVPTTTDRTFQVGGDAKIGIGPSLNLDLTVNPDFSQVEVDQQVTNLDRFEIFFPERRQFFLENADLFSSFGNERLRPFFSRRIGVARDESTGQNVQNPIYYGARLSGKLNNNWRLGLLNMQTASDKSINQPTTNFTVAAVQRKVFSRSNVGLIAINKLPFENSAILDTTGNLFDSNRVLGADFNLASKDNTWNGKMFYHRSFSPDKEKQGGAAVAQIRYGTASWDAFATLQLVEDTYTPEVGFARRTGYQRVASTVLRLFYPSSKIVNNFGIGLDFDVLYSPVFNRVTDWDVNLLYNLKFQNTAELNVRLRREYIYLFDAFDPTNTEGLELAAETDYTINRMVVDYQTDFRKPLFFTLGSIVGEYYNGNRINLEGSLGYRFQPYGALSLDLAYNRIRLPEPYNDGNLVLVGPRLDLTFTKNLFWTTFVQYNNQIDNLNINSRFQWRFRPVSDLFIVYTDNYFPDDFVNKNRALVVKLTYWLNI
ncbi:MAG: carbohydrate binding family 9 domain-containing protein [Saprospiraceae bacterium]|nr:carbohydrate binding family 9 domain-containing protein [Saprospiraceae bacterium]